MFEEMMRQIRETVSKIISFIEIKSEVPEPSSEIPQQTDKIPQGKIPRNAKCPCGSGKKYKHCCGKLN
jgi:preprotein translocase subunit SecA